MSTPDRPASVPETVAAENPVLWMPPPARVAAAHLTRFQALIRERTGRQLRDYASLHRWSVEEPAEFWGLCADFAGLQWSRPPTAVLSEPDRFPGARWFPGATLNVAEHLLADADDRERLVYRDEAGRRRAFTGRELRGQVARIAAGLREQGIGPGDSVAGWLPNCPEAVIAFLAASSVGAVWSSCSPDFGAAGVLDRFGQIGPKAVFVADGYRYGGRQIDLAEPLSTIRHGLRNVERWVLVPFLDGAASAIPAEGLTLWADFGLSGAPFAPAPLPFEHPLCVLFTSGTTGPPKCIVHGAGGTLLQHLKEHLLHGDLHRDDTIFYYTTTGWMMWNWLVSALATRATVLLYDGSPQHPGADVLWRLAAEEGVTHFGTSPRYLTALEKSGYRPAEHQEMPALRTVYSTGAPLAPESFDFVYRSIKADVQVASISGGTDLVSCFALGNPLQPVRRGELQGAGLGMAVDVVDEAGRPLAAGKKGELTCARPFPTVPLGFLGDDGSAFHRAYFARFPGRWAHGDWAEWTASGGLVIHGRADAVLNPGGVRIGTAELYRVVAALPEILECVAVEQKWQRDSRIVLAVVLDRGHPLDEELQQRIRNAIRRDLTPRHVPAVILAVNDIPRTRSGKLSELAVRAVIHGELLANTEALANPEALDCFRHRPELE